MENSIYYPEICGAGERSGLYYTCINSYLTADELAYIINNSESQIIFTSTAKSRTLKEALAQCPNVKRCYVIGDIDADLNDDRFKSYHDAIEDLPTTPVADESLGTSMLYSSVRPADPKYSQAVRRIAAVGLSADDDLPEKIFGNIAKI